MFKIFLQALLNCKCWPTKQAKLKQNILLLQAKK